MSRDGSGVYNLPEAAFVYDTVIDETAVNSNFSDIASALTASIAKDGQTSPTANLPMATYRHTGVGNATARTDYAATGQVQDGAFTWCTVGGTADAITLTPVPAITAHATGQEFRFIATATNTGATTIAVSGLTAKAAQNDGAALAAGDITNGKMYSVTYDGTQFQVARVRIGGVGSLTAADIGVTVQAYDADTAKLDVAQVYTAPQTPGSQPLVDAATVAIAITAQVWTLTTTASRIIGAPTGGVANTSYRLVLTSGGFTPSWNTAFVFPGGTVPSGLTGLCIFDFHYDGTKFNCTGQNIGEA